MNHKLKPFIQAFFVVIPISLLVSLVSVVMNYGFGESWMRLWITAWMGVFPTAYSAGFVFIPLANRLVNKIVWK